MQVRYLVCMGWRSRGVRGAGRKGPGSGPRSGSGSLGPQGVSTGCTARTGSVFSRTVRATWQIYIPSTFARAVGSISGMRCDERPIGGTGTAGSHMATTIPYLRLPSSPLPSPSCLGGPPADTMAPVPLSTPFRVASSVVVVSYPIAVISCP